MALGATLVGFGLLVVALVTGTLWLAVACIVVCVIGGLFLLADLLGLGDTLTRRRGEGELSTVGSDERTGAADPADTLTAAGADMGFDTGDSVSDTGSESVSDTEVTTEFPKIDHAEPIVSLDGPESGWQSDIADSAAAGLSEDAEPAAPTRHGRHESPTYDESAPEIENRHGRHGRPD